MTVIIPLYLPLYLHLAQLTNHISPGYLETTEGLDQKLSRNYYGRLRFAHQLLPLLHSASPQISRVISVLGAGAESSSFDLSDLDLKQNFSINNAARHAIVMTDFAFEEAAKLHPTTSFIHSNPGMVKTGFMRETGPLVRFAGNVAMALMSPFAVDIEECGERHLFVATSDMYPPREQYNSGGGGGGEGEGKGGGEGGIEIPERGGVQKGTDGVVGSGAYPTGWNGEFKVNEKVLKQLRGQDAGPKIWGHLMETFRSVRG